MIFRNGILCLGEGRASSAILSGDEVRIIMGKSGLALKILHPDRSTTIAQKNISYAPDCFEVGDGVVEVDGNVKYRSL